MRVLTLPDLALVERPDPRPGEGELLVAVRTAGLNRADLLQRLGRYPAPAGWPDDVPGLEYAGTVAAVGPGVTGVAVGDRVMGLVGGGAMAEQLVVRADEVVPVPDGLDDAEAAAVPEAFLTAWDALVVRGCAAPGDRVLVHAVGSGVGTAAVQFAPLLGVTLIGTSRTQAKLDRCRALGMHHGVLTSAEAWPAAVGAPVQVIVDTLGAAALEANLQLLAPLGRLVVLGTMTGHEAPINLGLVLRKRLTIVGTAMRSRSAEERRDLVARFRAEVLPHLARGVLRPVVEVVLPMTDAARGYERLAGNATFGKVIFRW